MSKQTVIRFREGLRNKSYSLTDVARLSGIPLTTLADMQKDEWGERLFASIERLDSLDKAICSLEAQETAPC